MKYILLLFIFIGFVAMGQDTLMTEVESYADISYCYQGKPARGAYYLIKNTRQEDTILRGCKGYINLPELDFTKQNVVLYNYSTGGSVLKTTCKLYTIPAQKKYIVSVVVGYDVAVADINAAKHIFAILPVLDPSYTIVCKTDETHKPPPLLLKCGNESKKKNN
ncbi:MAG TPA: hypothetical protein VKG26_09540 [Bacteroidia bacterium]|nr:hypothetical protein [Bacteroidia bacterium]